MAGRNGPRKTPRPTSSASALERQRRTRHKTIHTPVTEPILLAIEESFKEHTVVLRLANALREEWVKQCVNPQPEPITATWDSRRPKVLLVVHHDGYIEAYGRDLDVYAVELQPWEDAEEEVAKLPLAYKDVFWPQLIRETALVKWTRRPLIICDDVLERVDRCFILEEARCTTHSK